MGRGTLPGWSFGVRPMPTNSTSPDFDSIRQHTRVLRGLDKVRQFPTHAGPFFPTDMMRGTEVPSLPGHMAIQSGAFYTKILNLA